jgi:O-antigen/teichoic acid export membrane protein
LTAVPQTVDEFGPAGAPATRFAPDDGVDLRARTARGSLVNATFLVATNATQLIKGIAVAALLSTAAYGTWGLLMATFMTLLMLGGIGVEDRYIQQDEPDQVQAFQIAFTLQVVLCGLLGIAMLVGIPAFALLYRRPQMIAPGLVFALALPALALQMPIWVHYRRMDFVRQRTLQAIDPLVSLVAVLGLAIAGLGVWALVIGELIGTWCAAIAIMRSSPYRLRLRFDRAAMRQYTAFSWPLFVAALGGVLVVQVPVATASRAVGVSAVAALALAGNISQFSTQVDSIVTQTLYPAICAVRDRTELLLETFSKSNRLALLWAVPLGVGVALFSGRFVALVIGEKWRFAVPLLTAFGLNAAINQVGFNWTAFFRAIGETRPIGVATVWQVASILVIAVPLLIADGLTGYAVGAIAATVIAVLVRLWYLRRLFPSLTLARHITAGVAPTLPGAAAVLVVRGLAPASGGWLRAAAEAAGYLLVVSAATLVLQRPLLIELLGYVRGRSPASRREPAAEVLAPRAAR